jgi:hypothetical protein
MRQIHSTTPFKVEDSTVAFLGLEFVIGSTIADQKFAGAWLTRYSGNWIGPEKHMIA